MVTKRKSFQFILCPRKNPKIQESCKKQSDTSYQRQGQLKNARRNKNRLGFNLPPPSLCFFGFSNGLSIQHDELLVHARPEVSGHRGFDAQSSGWLPLRSPR